MCKIMQCNAFLFVSTLFFVGTFGDVQFCYKGFQNLKSIHCPYGLLFKEPVIIGAVKSIMENYDLDLDLQFCFRKDICTLDKHWNCSNQLQYVEVQLIVPNKTIVEKSTWIEGEEIISYDVPICESFFDDNNYSFNGLNNKNRVKRQVNPNPTNQDKKKNSDAAVQAVINEETKRMFYFITGVNVEDISSHLRVTKLFHNAVRLVNMICDPLFLKEEFLDNVEKGFMYLLKQQGLERIIDVDVDDFSMLQRALEYCMGDPDATVWLEGNHCPANFYIESVRKNTIQIPFDREDQANFIWGKHDLLIDAAWKIIDIVHGMCFATFKENLNLHHKFTVVMEQLFRDAIHLRWNSVTQFQRDDRVDNIFSVPVNMSMEALDACSHGAYIESPFLHRLQRPDINSGLRRKRRSMDDSETTLKDAAYCLQSHEELMNKMQKLSKKQCS